MDAIIEPKHFVKSEMPCTLSKFKEFKNWRQH